MCPGPGLLYLGTTDLWGHTVSTVSCLLEEVQQPPWPLPTRCQEQPAPSCDNQKCLQTLPDIPRGQNLSP